MQIQGKVSDIDRVASVEQTEVLSAFSRIPYALINAELSGGAKSMLEEMTEIAQFYKIYREGARFAIEGTNGDYVPAVLRYRTSSVLVNKQARFLFAEAPDMKVEAKGDVGKVSEDAKNAITILNDLVKTVLDTNKFEEQLIKAAKDCFIGKRVAGMVNFNEDDGVTITFLPSTQFVYETRDGNPNIITKFVAFVAMDASITNKKRIFRKRYTLEESVDHPGQKVAWLEESLHDSVGTLIEVITEKQETLLPMIPVCVFINDGLTGDMRGESEIEVIEEFEKYYSKLANADIDAQRKSMNPVTFAIDMERNSTKGLRRSAGSFWDLQTDQGLKDGTKGSVGILESNMNYSGPLGTSLDRVRGAAFEQLDMPVIDLESMSGMITSGKALKAIYWPLIVRCKEKMKMWGPQLRAMISIIIEGAKVYPNTIVRYTNATLMPVAYETVVEANHPLPEDEIEEKNMDLAEVAARTMSRKTFMQKWHTMTDDEVMAELEQIALERQILDDAQFTGVN